MREQIVGLDDVKTFLGTAFKSADEGLVELLYPEVEDAVKKFLGYEPMLSWAAISAASNATPIQITTTTAHNFPNGASVLISGVGGNLAANGWWFINVVDSVNFTLYGPMVGKLVSASESGSTVTLIFGNPPVLSVGQSIVINGFPPPATGYNGTWTVTSVVGTTVTFACTSTGLPPVGQANAPGTTTMPNVIVCLNSVGNGAYTSGGMVSQNNLDFYPTYDRDLKLDYFADDTWYSYRVTPIIPISEKEIRFLNVPINNVQEVRFYQGANGTLWDFSDPLAILDPSAWSWSARGILQRNYGVWPIKRGTVMVTSNSGYTANTLAPALQPIAPMAPILSITDDVPDIRIGTLMAVQNAYIHNKRMQAQYTGGTGPIIKEEVPEYKVTYEARKFIDPDVILTVAVQERLEPYCRFV